MPEPVDLDRAFASFDAVWEPKIVAALNGQLVKVVRFDGEYVWHDHADEDELFWVLEGRVRILFRDGEVSLGPGQLYVVPRGVEHKPVAQGLAKVVLFEPDTTVNTGDVREARTRRPDELERL
jgi:mannose-6-phosphate isomerase-like protein (cupin superfamily)